MKRWLLTVAVLGVAAYLPDAKAEPKTTWYGLINQEIRHVEQDREANARKFTGVTTVDGFETRMGVKGDAEENISFQLEMGLNPTLDAATGGQTSRIRVRMANVSFKDETWGTLLFGQAWVPASLQVFKIDPFMGTGFENFGLDNANVIGSSTGNGLGYVFRAFKDMTAYTTPTFAGFSYSVSYDQDNTILDRTQATTKYVTHLLAYEQKFDDVGVNAFVDYGYPELDKRADRAHMTVGTRVAFSGFGVSAAWGNQGEQKTGVSEFYKKTRLFGAVDYTMEKWKFAASYGKLDRTDDDALGGYDQQTAVGAFYSVSERTTLRAGVAHYRTTRKEGVTIAAMDKSDNEAVTGMLGVTVKF